MEKRERKASETMRAFVRGQEPEGLVKARREKKSWDDLNKTERGRKVKEDVRNALLAAQRGFCAYCETRLLSKRGEFEGHVEHLDRRADSPERSCEWNNLFLSCSRADSCGKYKDNPKNKIRFWREDIVDPSREDPQEFFEYSELDGAILARKGIPENERRARETIRVFNLANSQRLRGLRRRIALTIRDFRRCNPEASEDEVDSFLSVFENEEMFSVYCALLGKNCPNKP